MLIRVLGGLLAAFMATNASAAVVISASERDDDVIFSFSGTLDLSGLALLGTGLAETAEQGFIGPADGAFVSLPLAPLRPDGTKLYDSYAAGPFASFGAMGTTRGEARGDPFGLIRSGRLFVPQGFQSGDSLSGQLVYFGQSLAALDVRLGASETVTLPSGDTIVLTVPENPAINEVPLPAAALLLAPWLLALRRRA